jgi:hypothetical protein
MIPTWAERCEKFDDGEIVTNRKIQQVMQEEIDDLRKELALQKLSDIVQEIETLDTRSYLIGRYDGLRELTDGEILNIYLEQTNGNEDLDIIKFAKEILKKASEK